MNRRIALISEHASPLAHAGGVDAGGQVVYVGNVARQLAARGYEVDVFTRADRPDAEPVVEWLPGVRVFHVHAGPARAIPKEDLLPLMGEFTHVVLDAALRRRYELVHANFWMSGLVAVALKQELNIPFVVTFHGLGRVRRLHQGAADRSPVERTGVEERVVAQADHIIALCPRDQDDLIRLYSAPPSRVTIVPGGFDPDEFAPMDAGVARRALGLPPDEPVVLHVGRVVPRKGIDTAIDGFARLFVDHGFASGRLVVVGGSSEQPDVGATPEIGRLRGVAEREGVAERVTFAGRRRREELQYFYCAADAVVTVPWYEPFGLVAVEAMACGTPVVGADVGGIGFTVRDGETGYLVSPKDPAALAERLATLLGDRERRQQFGRQAYRLANHLFTWKKVVGTLDDVYRDVLRAVHADRPLRLGSRAVVDRGFSSAVQAIESSRRTLRGRIVETAEVVVGAYVRGGTILLCGSDKSAANAQHFASELVGRFRNAERPVQPAVALTTDGAFATALANTDDVEDGLARQVEAQGREGDVLVAFSTSGRSRSLASAFKAARLRGMQCVAILGCDGGELVSLADDALVAPSFNEQDILAVHTIVIHVICDLVEEALHARQRMPLARPTGTQIGHQVGAGSGSADPKPPIALPAPLARSERGRRPDDVAKENVT